MLGLQTIPFINKDSGRLVYIKYKNTYFNAKQVLSLNPLRFSQKAKPLAANPELPVNVVGLKKQLIFTQQRVYLGRLRGWQFDQQGLFLTNIIIVDTNLWRRIMGKLNPDFIIARSQIREFGRRKIVVDSDGQLVQYDNSSFQTINN